MADIYWAIDVVATSFDACLSWFGTVITSVDGASGIMIAAFFMAMLISAFIIPLRGAGMSDRVKRTKDGKSVTIDYNHTKRFG